MITIYLAGVSITAIVIAWAVWGDRQYLFEGEPVHKVAAYLSLVVLLWPVLWVWVIYGYFMDGEE